MGSLPLGRFRSVASSGRQIRHLVLRGTCERKRGDDAAIHIWFTIGCVAWVTFTTAGAAAAAFVVNAHWYVLYGSDRSDLRNGYFLWWLSFALPAIGLFDSHGADDGPLDCRNERVTATLPRSMRSPP